MPVKKETKNKILRLFLIGFVLVVFFAGFNFFDVQTKEQKLNEEDLVKLIKPAVVRIINHTQGTVNLADFDLDLKNKKITFKENVFLPETKIDEFFSGSGFVINPDGLILTNAHVVLEETSKTYLVEKILEGKIKSDPDYSDFKKTPENYENLLYFIEDALKQLQTRSQFYLKTEITVLSPSDPQEYLTSLLQNGFKAEIVAANKNFLKDDKDFAIIKIAEKNLPSLLLGNSEKTAISNKLFIFGFPASADFNQKSPVESTLTQGIISAFKFSQNKDFRIFQTDAKVSHGSSGGPVINEQGDVIGLTTFQSSPLQQNEGDNFAFAIPINTAKTFLETSKIQNLKGPYTELFLKGLSFYKTKQCKTAQENFKQALKTNKDFIGGRTLESYQKNCQKLIESGLSVDNSWNKLWFWLKSIAPFTWFVIAGRVILILLATWFLLLLFSRIKKDEKEIDRLAIKIEEETEKQKKLHNLEQYGTPLPLPDIEEHSQTRLNFNLAHPHLSQFVEEGRLVGLSNEETRAELKKAGWADEEINLALKE